MTRFLAFVTLIVCALYAFAHDVPPKLDATKNDPQNIYGHLPKITHLWPGDYLKDGDINATEWDRERMDAKLPTDDGIYIADIENLVKPPADATHAQRLEFYATAVPYWAEFVAVWGELRPQHRKLIYQVETRSPSYRGKHQTWIQTNGAGVSASDRNKMARWTREAQETGEALRPLLEACDYVAVSVYPLELDSKGYGHTENYAVDHIYFCGRYRRPVIAWTWRNSAHERSFTPAEYRRFVIKMSEISDGVAIWGASNEAPRWDGDFTQMTYTYWHDIEPPSVTEND